MKKPRTESLVVDLGPVHPALRLLQLALEGGRGAADAAALRVHDGACAQVAQLVQLHSDSAREGHRLWRIALQRQNHTDI